MRTALIAILFLAGCATQSNGDLEARIKTLENEVKRQKLYTASILERLDALETRAAVKD